MQQETDAALGDLLRDLRTQRGLSVKRLATLAGVARKTIDNAEAGLNVSVVVLKKLLGALGVEEVTIRVAGPHAARVADAVPPPLLSGLVDQIRRGSQMVSSAAGQLHELTSGEQAQTKLIVQAETLIKSFTAFVRSVEDADQLTTLEQSVTSLYAPQAKRTATLSRRRRRKLA